LRHINRELTRIAKNIEITVMGWLQTPLICNTVSMLNNAIKKIKTRGELKENSHSTPIYL